MELTEKFIQMMLNMILLLVSEFILGIHLEIQVLKEVLVGFTDIGLEEVTIIPQDFHLKILQFITEF